VLEEEHLKPKDGLTPLVFHSYLINYREIYFMNFSKIFLTFILAIILVGCPSSRMSVKILSSTTKNVSIEMFQTDGFLRRKYAPKVSSIYFSKSLPESQMRLPMWSIECDDERYAEITYITYGELPVGFIALDRIQPVQIGDTLFVSFWTGKNPSTILGTAEIKIH
jgi:hypothetical protein